MAGFDGKPLINKIKGDGNKPFIGFWNYTVYLTYLGLTSAVIGMTQAVAHRNKYALLCLIFAGTCDMFDGKIARHKKDRTEDEKLFGIQIDSLCDVICFGMLPATIGFSMNNPRHKLLGTVASCLFVLAAVVRLAFFNVMEENRQKVENGCRRYYQGLPVTSVALILPFVYCICHSINPDVLATTYSVAMIFISFLFVANIKVHKPGNFGVVVMTVIGLAVLASVILVL